MSPKYNELTADLVELQRLHETSFRPSNKKLLEEAITKLKEEIAKVKPQEEAKTESSSDKRYTVTLRTYSWDESDKFMKLYVNITELEPGMDEKATCDFEPLSISVSVAAPKANYKLTINQLAAKIVPAKSYFKVKKGLLVLFMAKEKQGETWECVTAQEKKTKIDKKPEPKMDADPNESIMGMMKKMYDEGDSNMKQMLNKTWYESQQKQASGNIDKPW